MNVCGIDPANHTGLAVVSLSGELIYSVLLTDSADLQEEMDNLACIGVHQIVIEEQYVAANKATALKLARRAGIWAGLAIAYEIPHVFVSPQTWQTQELGCGARTRRADRKRLAMEKCRGLWPGVDLTQDEADAALIARYAAVELERLERVRRLAK
jgi:Holliday junction resolvasome RuvABC endonuclease subunit